MRSVIQTSILFCIYSTYRLSPSRKGSLRGSGRSHLALQAVSLLSDLMLVYSLSGLHRIGISQLHLRVDSMCDGLASSGQKTYKQLLNAVCFRCC